jgi:hypothetical protein
VFRDKPFVNRFKCRIQFFMKIIHIHKASHIEYTNL